MCLVVVTVEGGGKCLTSLTISSKTSLGSSSSCKGPSLERFCAELGVVGLLLPLLEAMLKSFQSVKEE